MQQERWQRQRGWLTSNINVGTCNEGGGQRIVMRAVAMATATMWTMATLRRLAGKEEEKGKGGKSRCDGNEGGGDQRG